MSEMDPTHQLEGLGALRQSMLNPRSVRKVLWLASSQIMADKTLEGPERKLAGSYLETIFRAIDNSEAQDAAFATDDKCPANTPLNMGSLMSWAFTDVYIESFPEGFDPSNRGHREANVYVRLHIGLTEAHLNEAYQRYLDQQEAQARDAGRPSVKWF